MIDLFGRRLLASATGPSPNAQLCKDAIKIAVAARGGKDNIAGVIFHSDRGSTYTDHSFSALCAELGITQSMGRPEFRRWWAHDSAKSWVDLGKRR